MVRVVLKCIVLCICAFLCNNYYCNFLGTSDTYLYSNENIAFMLVISVILSFKYDVLRIIIQSKSKKMRYITAFSFVVLFFAIVNLTYFVNVEKYDINKLENDFSFKSFIFLPQRYSNIHLELITGCDLLISIILISLKLARDEIVECKNKILSGRRAVKAYLLEQIVRFYCKYNFPIIFTINLLMIPKKYVVAEKWVNFGIIFFIVSQLILALRIIRSLSACFERDKSKIGKDKLIIVLTMHNYKFSFRNDFKKCVSKVCNIHTKDIFNDLAIYSKDYTMVSYEAIRNNLIDINKYKNISYFIVLKEGWLNRYTEGFRWKEFYNKVEQISEKTENYVIYSRINNIRHIKLAKEIKDRHEYKMVINPSIEKLITTFEQNKRDIELKTKVRRILNYIEEKDKGYDIRNKYIKYELKGIIDSFNYKQYFYSISKLSEYIIHYMALRSLLRNKNNIAKEEIAKGNLEQWIDCISYDKEYSIKEEEIIVGVASKEEVYNSIMNIYTALNKKRQPNNSRKYSFKLDICGIFKTVNETINLSKEKSDDIIFNIVYDLLNIAFLLIYEFEELNIPIEEGEKIKDVFSRPTDAIIIEHNKLYLFTESNTGIRTNEELNKEYFNYETGKYSIIGNKLTYYLNHRWTENEVKNMEEKMG